MSSVADQHKSAEVILNVGCPNHGEVVLQNAYYIYIILHIQVFCPRAQESSLPKNLLLL